MGGSLWAQTDQSNNPISTVVPFLNFAPDSRSSGMGDVGVSTSPDINSQHWNPAKFAFMESNAGVSFSVTPWLRKLVDDINLFYATGYYKLDNLQAVSASVRYFSLGELNYTNEEGDYIYTGKPNEFALDVAYSRLLSEKFSGSIAMRYIRSHLSQGSSSATDELKAGNSFAADIAFYFRHQTAIKRNRTDISAGIVISNIGSKMTYDDQNKEYLPANLKLGGGISYEVDPYNELAFHVELNKLLVPTPISLDDDPEQDYKNLSVPASIFKSFGDAPGGFKEEMQEINFSVGVEYIYNKLFALRAGYFHEHENKGNRKFASAGAGIKFNMISIDASYVIPVVANNPLSNTVRLSLSFDMGKTIKKSHR